MSPIIKICLYQHSFEKKSMLLTSLLDGECKPESDEWRLEKVVFAINPTLRPYPPRTNTICVTDKKVRATYDPFKERNCAQFIAWLSPVPNTIPLYISKGNENYIYLSFTEKNEPKRDMVLADELITTIYLLPTEKDSFAMYNGRFIPSPTGIPLLKLLEWYVSTIRNEDTLGLLNIVRREPINTTFTNIFLSCIFLFIMVYVILIMSNMQ